MKKIIIKEKESLKDQETEDLGVKININSRTDKGLNRHQ